MYVVQVGRSLSRQEDRHRSRSDNARSLLVKEALESQTPWNFVALKRNVFPSLSSPPWDPLDLTILVRTWTCSRCSRWCRSWRWRRLRFNWIKRRPYLPLPTTFTSFFSPSPYRTFYRRQFLLRLSTGDFAMTTTRKWNYVSLLEKRGKDGRTMFVEHGIFLLPWISIFKVFKFNIVRMHTFSSFISFRFESTTRCE